MVPVLGMPRQEKDPQACWRLQVAAPVLAALLTTPAGFLFWTGHRLRLRLLQGLRTARPVTGLTNTGSSRRPVRADPADPGRRCARPCRAATGCWPGSAVAVLVGFHFFGDDDLQLIPSVALLATAALQILPATAW